LLWSKLPTEAEFVIIIDHQRGVVCNTGVGSETKLMKIQAIGAQMTFETATAGIKEAA